MGLEPKAYLGSGWRFPVVPVGGRLLLVRHEEAVEQAVGMALLTARGERVMLPAYGAGLRDFVFEPNGAATHRVVEEAVRQALTDWEPRIALERVAVSAGEDEPGLLLIEVDYRVLATNAFYNRVYPFYLFEGA